MVQFTGRNQGNFQQRRKGQAPNGASMIRGEIQSIENGTMTVKLDDGSSKLVLVSESTPINKSESGLIADLKVGEGVVVFGSANTEGLITAVNIQIGLVRMEQNLK